MMFFPNLIALMMRSMIQVLEKPGQQKVCKYFSFFISLFFCAYTHSVLLGDTEISRYGRDDEFRPKRCALLFYLGFCRENGSICLSLLQSLLAIK